MSSEHLEAIGDSLNDQLEKARLNRLGAVTTRKFEAYLDLILRWNAKMNLTAVRDAAGIVSRHFVESIVCAQTLPAGTATVLDFGSGAGFPGVPIALCRPEIKVTLAESQSKKTAFLREVARGLELNVRIFAGRAQDLREQFDCVTLRAVDRMEFAVAAAAMLVAPGGFLAVFTTEADKSILQAAGPDFVLSKPTVIVGAEQRILVFATKEAQRG